MNIRCSPPLCKVASLLYLMIQIMCTSLHYQINLSFGEEEPISWQDIRMTTVQLYFKLINHKINGNFLLMESLEYDKKIRLFGIGQINISILSLGQYFNRVKLKSAGYGHLHSLSFLYGFINTI